MLDKESEKTIYEFTFNLYSKHKNEIQNKLNNGEIIYETDFNFLDISPIRCSFRVLIDLLEKDGLNSIMCDYCFADEPRYYVFDYTKFNDVHSVNNIAKRHYLEWSKSNSQLYEE